MASSRVTSNGPDTVDVAEVIRAFEEQNNCLIVITLRPCRGQEKAGFWLEGKAVEKMDVNGVRSLLAFASVVCGEQGQKTMDSAALLLLYRLDFAIAELEWAGYQKLSRADPGAQG